MLQAQRKPLRLTFSVIVITSKELPSASLPRNLKGTPRCTRTSLRRSLRLPLTNSARLLPQQVEINRFLKICSHTEVAA